MGKCHWSTELKVFGRPVRVGAGSGEGGGVVGKGAGSRVSNQARQGDDALSEGWWGTAKGEG